MNITFELPTKQKSIKSLYRMREAVEEDVASESEDIVQDSAEEGVEDIQFTVTSFIEAELIGVKIESGANPGKKWSCKGKYKEGTALSLGLKLKNVKISNLKNKVTVDQNLINKNYDFKFTTQFVSKYLYFEKGQKEFKGNVFYIVGQNNLISTIGICYDGTTGGEDIIFTINQQDQSKSAEFLKQFGEKFKPNSTIEKCLNPYKDHLSANNLWKEIKSQPTQGAAEAIASIQKLFKGSIQADMSETRNKLKIAKEMEKNNNMLLNALANMKTTVHNQFVGY